MGLKDILKSSTFYEILQGMSVTGSYFVGEKVTVEYPKEQIPPFERFRGVQCLISDPETGELNCDACHICATICPSNCIFIESSEGPDGTKQLDSFVIDLTRCIFCGFCEEACPRAAIAMTSAFEFCTYNKNDLILTKDWLVENQKNLHKELRKR